ncbi:MAG: hypothetical protein H8E40_04880 [Chloroflexi bacterium]|nr:hypothetical protein [Chloroflexota bacterium]MBL7062163.1 hypothetical protein [Dehalococcoidia bacterium]
MKLKLVKFVSTIAIAVLLLVLSCAVPPETPDVPAPASIPTPTPTPQPELAAKEACEMAYEHASAKYDEKLYLSEVKAGGTVVVTHKMGHGAVEGGYEDTWDVVLHRRDSQSSYTQVLVYIRKGEVDHCSEAGTFGVYGGSWERHTQTQAVDISQLNALLDSPEAVNIAQERGDEGLGPMFVRLGRSVTCERKLVYSVILGPVTGEGGAGLEVYIDATGGTVLKIKETTWK